MNRCAICKNDIIGEEWHLMSLYSENPSCVSNICRKCYDEKGSDYKYPRSTFFSDFKTETEEIEEIEELKERVAKLEKDISFLMKQISTTN